VKVSQSGRKADNGKEHEGKGRAIRVPVFPH
jgi:hypothetical protein